MNWTGIHLERNGTVTIEKDFALTKGDSADMHWWQQYDIVQYQKLILKFALMLKYNHKMFYSAGLLSFRFNEHLK